MFAELGLQRLKGDQAEYYKKDWYVNLEGTVSTCVDNFDTAGKPSFVDMITEKVCRVLDMSKVDDDMFRYTVIDIKIFADGL